MEWTTEESWFYSRQNQRIFRFSETSTPTVGSTQPIIQWTQVPFYPGINRTGHEADLHLVMRLELCKSGPPLPPRRISNMCNGKIIFYLYFDFPSLIAIPRCSMFAILWMDNGPIRDCSSKPYHFTSTKK
jgi:hypothetical protein